MSILGIRIAVVESVLYLSRVKIFGKLHLSLRFVVTLFHTFHMEIRKRLVQPHYVVHALFASVYLIVRFIRPTWIQASGEVKSLLRAAFCHSYL